MSSSCSSCHKGPPEVTLKRCAKCSTTSYCSRNCQKADWKVHKKQCGKLCRDTNKDPATSPKQATSAGTVLSPPRGLDKPIAKPFTRLDNGTWFHDRPETDVYRLLIDTYRMHVEDYYRLDGQIEEDSLYAGAPDGLLGFNRFLRLAETCPGLLPPWWSQDKKTECEIFGMDDSNWSNLQYAVRKCDIIDHYGDPWFPLQLRMIALVVYGREPGGTCGAPIIRQQMVALENGELLPQQVFKMDMRTWQINSPIV